MVDVSLASIEAILPFIAIGFAAQLVDGALGMAFGLINSTPHSGLLPDEAMHALLRRMALGALGVPQA